MSLSCLCYLHDFRTDHLCPLPVSYVCPGTDYTVLNPATPHHRLVGIPGLLGPPRRVGSRQQGTVDQEAEGQGKSRSLPAV